MADTPTEAMIEAGRRACPEASADNCHDIYTAMRSSAPQEPDDELIERLKDMRDFCRGTTHTHPHPNNVARLCEDVLAVLQTKAGTGK
jgi:hypothetical protein